MSDDPWTETAAWEQLAQADPLVAAAAAVTIATALALVRGLPRLLGERNWARRRAGIAEARLAVSRAMRAELRRCLTAEDVAALEAARTRLQHLR